MEKVSKVATNVLIICLVLIVGVGLQWMVEGCANSTGSNFARPTLMDFENYDVISWFFQCAWFGLMTCVIIVWTDDSNN